MREVWKFGVAPPSIATDLPIGAKLLHFGHQEGAVFVWAEVDTTAAREPRQFRVYGTGWPIDPGFEHIGTTQVGGLVWHLYERRDEPAS